MATAAAPREWAHSNGNAQVSAREEVQRMRMVYEERLQHIEEIMGHAPALDPRPRRLKGPHPFCNPEDKMQHLR